MKRSLALILTLASGFALSAAAQTPAAPAAAPAGPTKVAVIAFQTAVINTNEGLRNLADVEKKFTPKEQQLKALSDEIDSLTKQLNAAGDKLAPAEQQSKTAAIDTKKKQLDRDSEDAKADYSQQMQEVYNTLASKVYDVMQSYADSHGYTLVLDVSAQTTPVLYATTSSNITKEVVDAYNQKSGIPAPPAAAGGAAAPKTTPRTTAPKPATAR